MQKQAIIIDTQSKYVTISLAMDLINKGFKLVGYKKHTKWFGLKTLSYIIVLEKILNFPEEIKKAIAEERYEDADKLQKQFNGSEADFYKELEAQKTKDLMVLPTLF